MANIFRSLIKLLLVAFAATMVLCMLLVGMVAALLALFWSLLTGRKPAAYSTFMHFRDASRQFQERTRSSHGNASSGNSADIVDVQAHEVRNVIRDER
jgi:hypothetical protein